MAVSRRWALGGIAGIVATGRARGVALVGSRSPATTRREARPQVGASDSFLFVDIGRLSFPSSVSRIRTAGYSRHGRGAAHYIATDDGILGRACAKSADGRWWRLDEPTPSIEMFGALGDGTDATAPMLEAHRTSKTVYYPNGVYEFNGKEIPNLNSKSITREGDGVIFRNRHFSGNIQFDRGGDLIGLMHNHLQFKSKNSQKFDESYINGNICPPPNCKLFGSPSICVAAYFYSDFGLECIRGNHSGWLGWYTWEWNHTDITPDVPQGKCLSVGYQSTRHPLLGWYRGDDPNVLGWQIYWLLEAGIYALVVQIRNGCYIDLKNWSVPEDENYFLFVILNNVPNAKAIKWIPWVPFDLFRVSGGGGIQIGAGWDRVISIFWSYGCLLTRAYDGGSFGVVYLWDFERLRGALDHYNGNMKTLEMLELRGAYARTLGLDGLIVLVRNLPKLGKVVHDRLKKSGIILLSSEYVRDSADDYSQLARHATWNGSAEAVVPNVFTEYLTVCPHPGGGHVRGSTPELFGEFLARAIDFAASSPNSARIVTVYSASEWAEGGSCLIPTLGNGWAYLDAASSSIAAKLAVSRGA